LINAKLWSYFARFSALIKTRACGHVDARENVLDLGCGPGYLAAEIAERVGSSGSGSVLGVDPSRSMLAVAARRDGAAAVQLVVGDGLGLPVTAGTFDAVTATQVYEYVPDMPAALAEVARVLRPGGRLLILDTDWDSLVWHSSDPARMRRVLTAWDEHLADPYLPRRLGRLLTDAGFAVTQRRVHPILNAGYEGAHLQRRRDRPDRRLRARTSRRDTDRGAGLARRSSRPGR
jgi:SAM-dependent methyltransferase